MSAPDTSPLTTACYGGWMFGRVLPDLETLANRTYDAINLCKPDFPFVQDGTRRDETFRLHQHNWYQEHLKKIDCPIMEAGGSIRHRVSSVANWISTLKID
jgi:HTH-type transcriptional regulator, transcriptional repressor of NAD biosynthesis genes